MAAIGRISGQAAIAPIAAVRGGQALARKQSIVQSATWPSGLMEFGMLGKPLAIIIAAGSVVSICEAQDIVLSDISPPDASSHTFSQTCGAVHHYALELSSTGEQKRILAHSNGKTSVVTPPNLLAQIGGYDLYSVRMHCAEVGGLFRIDVRKENGQFIEQDITVRDDGRALVETAHPLKRMPKSS